MEKDVRPLMRQVHVCYLAAADQLREPGIVKMASEVGRNNTTVPKAGNQHHGGYGDYPAPILSQKGADLRERGTVIARHGAMARPRELRNDAVSCCTQRARSSF